MRYYVIFQTRPYDLGVPHMAPKRVPEMAHAVPTKLGADGVVSLCGRRPQRDDQLCPERDFARVFYPARCLRCTELSAGQNG